MEYSCLWDEIVGSNTNTYPNDKERQRIRKRNESLMVKNVELLHIQDKQRELQSTSPCSTDNSVTASPIPIFAPESGENLDVGECDIRKIDVKDLVVPSYPPQYTYWGPEMATKVTDMKNSEDFHDYSETSESMECSAQNARQSMTKRRRRSHSLDPNRIKRPMNSFLLFSNEIRPILQSRHRDKSNAQISKLVGEEWHKLEDEKKKVFTERAEKIKEEFNRQHPNFVYTKRRRRKSQYLKQLSHGPYTHYSLQNSYNYGMHMNEFGMEESMMSFDDMGQGFVGHPFPYANGGYMRHHLNSPFPFPIQNRGPSLYNNHPQPTYSDNQPETPFEQRDPNVEDEEKSKTEKNKGTTEQDMVTKEE